MCIKTTAPAGAVTAAIEPIFTALSPDPNMPEPTVTVLPVPVPGLLPEPEPPVLPEPEPPVFPEPEPPVFPEPEPPVFPAFLHFPTGIIMTSPVLIALQLLRPLNVQISCQVME